MTIAELMWFIKPFYPTWDDAECQRLLKHFELDPNKRIRELSKGMVAKVALTLALAHRPEILILDEPTGGLDAIVRREFLESIVNLVEEGGRTVFISSHLLSDVERVADHVAVIEGGKVIAQEPLKSLKDRVRQIRLRFTANIPERVVLDGLLHAKRHNHEWVITVSNFIPELPQQLRQRLGAEAVEMVDLSLEDVFIELVGERPTGVAE
jgi:ABC-2 type transport system ATP-binding protein